MNIRTALENSSAEEIEEGRHHRAGHQAVRRGIHRAKFLSAFGPHGNCPLMNEDGRCSVHDCKPVVCALYPLGRVIMSAQPGAALEDTGEVRVKYIMNDYNCGSAKRTNTVRDWLARFHIPEHDEFFLQWNHLIVAISTAAHKLQDEGRERDLRELWDFTFSRLYLNYDVHEDLKEQFERNSREIEDYLGAIGPKKG